MQSDAVNRYHWMTGGQFLNAVALGQVTPGPGRADGRGRRLRGRGVGGALLAAAIVFAPSFAFVLLGGAASTGIRADERARAFLDGAGPAAIGAIIGSAIPLARASASRGSSASSRARRCRCSFYAVESSSTLLAAGAVGVVVALAGGPCRTDAEGTVLAMTMW